MDSALAINLRRLRKIRKLTQSELAKKVGISRNAYRNIETGKSEPRSSTLHSIAKALDVSVFDLVIEIPAIGNLRFRTGGKMTGWERAEREQIVLEVAKWLRDYNGIEKMTGEQRPFIFEGIRFDRKDPVSSAYTARAVLMLDDEDYIRDFSSLLENAGIKLLLLISRMKGYFGLSVGTDDGDPAIVVNAGDWIPVESQIFTAARELGHILMHPESCRSDIIEKDNDQKQEAAIFASYFLMPKSHFDERLEACRGSHWIDSVLHIKRLFSVSYKTVLNRLVTEGAAGSDIYGKFVHSYNSRYDRKLIFREGPEEYLARSEEPSSLDRTDFFEDRLARLVMKALDGHLISMSRAAEILNISVNEMREKVREWYSFNRSARG